MIMQERGLLIRNMYIYAKLAPSFSLCIHWQHAGVEETSSRDQPSVSSAMDASAKAKPFW